jgi:hypothetical protein
MTEALKPLIGAPFKWEETVASMLDDSDGEQPTTHFTLLQGCDVLWTTIADPKRHGYTNGVDVSDAVHAVLINEKGAILPSTLQPGRQILIKDELSLWDNALWINDRGYDVESGDFIYGNQRGIPYKVKRVENLNNDNDEVDNDIQKKKLSTGGPVVNEDLKWTLGDQWRTEEEYTEKMKQINM